MTVLLNVMVNKSHTILSDEISMTIYNMASVDFNYFFSKFLPDYLKQTDNIRNDQRQFLRQKRMQPVKVSFIIYRLCSYLRIFLYNIIFFKFLLFRNYPHLWLISPN